MNIAILGAGNIAGSMARTLRGMKARGQNVELYAVASRDLKKAQVFAEKEGFAKAYGSYEEMLADDGVELVYVATPHSHHAEHMKLCLKYGRAILCEKAFTGNARQAEEVLAMAKEKGVFLTEAIWTRYMPSRQIINDLVASGIIGTPKVLTANLGYVIDGKERIFKPELAGGALLDLGVYTLNFASMVFGDDVVRMESSVGMMDSGVDHTENITLHYRDGKTAHLLSTAMALTDRHGVISGDKGYLVVDNINNPLVIEVYDNTRSGKPVQVVNVPEQITGYEYQVEACMRAMAAGELECSEMPHSETLHIMRVMDELRAQWNMVYPFD
ncbi:MAG: Gfo/Idh/MocA family oxidoreductase [Clostridiales bacterium]|nr:Gfo/Idh/MocA family oxidoreductase [Clostridiales bacterium]